jgi:hypothetical protein
MKISNIALVLLIAISVVGCKTPGSPDVKHTSTSTHILAYPVDDSTGMLAEDPVANFTLTLDRRYEDGDPDSANLTAKMKNITDDIISFNFRLSGLTWQYSDSAVQLEPGETINFGVISHDFDALNEYWLVITSPVTILASNG